MQCREDCASVRRRAERGSPSRPSTAVFFIFRVRDDTRGGSSGSDTSVTAPRTPRHGLSLRPRPRRATRGVVLRAALVRRGTRAGAPKPRAPARATAPPSRHWRTPQRRHGRRRVRALQRAEASARAGLPLRIRRDAHRSRARVSSRSASPSPRVHPPPPVLSLVSPETGGTSQLSALPRIATTVHNRFSRARGRSRPSPRRRPPSYGRSLHERAPSHVSFAPASHSSAPLTRRRLSARAS